MADKVELKSAPPAPDTGADKLPEAKVQESRGNTAQVTVNTEQKPKEPEKKPERPAWLPEEFNTPEEFAEAYRKSVAEKAKTETAKKTEVPDPKTATKDQVEQTIQKAGLDMAKLSQEFAKEGKLSEDSLESLEKAGITREVVDQYIEGQKAQAEAITKRLHDAVGGEENLKATLEWAATALSPEEIAAANKALTSGDEAQMKLVLTGLNTRRLQETGIEPQFVGGRPTPSRGEVRGYESTAEWIRDVNTPEYRTDPAFREKVMRRVAASKF